LHNKPTSRSWDLLEMMPVIQLLINLLKFYKTQGFITIQKNPPQDPIQRNIDPAHTASSHSFTRSSIHLGLAFPSGFSTTYLHAFLYTHLSCYMHCPSHPPWLHLPWPQYKYSPQHHVLKHPQSMLLPLHQRPTFTHIRSTHIITVSYILMFMFLDNSWQDRRFWTEW
jgi:hypothetical protein